MVSGCQVQIYDYLDDVSDDEALIIMNYLHSEGFIAEDYGEYRIIRSDI